jgi:hypothetical protein
MSRVTRRWEDYAKAVMQEQDHEKLGYLLRQLNLALNGNQKPAFPPMRRKTDTGSSDEFHGERGTDPTRGMPSAYDPLALLPEAGPAETGQQLEPEPIVSLPCVADTVPCGKESITGRVDRLRIEVADIRQSNKEYLQLKPNQSTENGHFQRRFRLKQIVAELEGLRNRTMQLR